MMTRVTALLALIAVGACAASPPPQPTVGDLQSCTAAQYLPLVGQDQEALMRTLILRQVRVLRPGDIATTDIRPDRITFEIDALGTVTALRCG